MPVNSPVSGHLDLRLPQRPQANIDDATYADLLKVFIALRSIQAFVQYYQGQFTTANAPAYAPGLMYYDLTLYKLRIGGATAWETITSA